MKVPYLKFLLKRDVYTSASMLAPPHEMLLLGFIYGQGNIENVEVSEYAKELEPAAEYTRLTKRYGINPEEKRPWVRELFGHFANGEFTKNMEMGAKEYQPIQDELLGTMVAERAAEAEQEVEPVIVRKRASVNQSRASV